MKRFYLLAVVLLIAAVTLTPTWGIGAATSADATYSAGRLTGPSFYWYNNLNTTGDLMRLKLLDAKLTSDGAYISCLGGTGATEVWKVGEGGVETFKGGATIDNATSATVLNLTESTVQVTGILRGQYDAAAYWTATQADGGLVTFDSTSDGTAGFTFQDIINANAGIAVDSTAFTVTDATGAVSTTSTRTSQTTENTQEAISLTTDSTYLTGTDITYSGGRGSSALKLTGVWSGTSGGYSNIYSNITKSGATSAAVDGVIGIKSIVTNTGAMTDGSVYGGQFWAKHSHATADMANEAALIGLEGIAYDATSGGTVGTLIGGNFGYHNEVDTAKPAGSVYRAVQIVCDDAAGSDVADEATGLAIWNMAGTQTNGIKFIKSDGGFTTDVTLQNAETISNATDGTIAVSGVLSANPRFATVVVNTDASETLTAAQSGALVTCSNASGSTTITLPDPSAATIGVVYEIMQIANQNVIIVPTTANGNSLVAEGVATSDSVTLTNATNKIGVAGKVIGISATQWFVMGYTETILTVEAAD